MAIHYPDIPGIILGASLGGTMALVGIPLLFYRAVNKPSRVHIAVGSMAFGFALAAVAVPFGIYAGHGIIESAFSGGRGIVVQVGALVFGSLLLVAEVTVWLFRSMRGSNRGTT